MSQEAKHTSRTFEFTDRALKGLPVPPKDKPEEVWDKRAKKLVQPPYGQVDYFDAKARGLGLRISYGGRKSFFAMYSNSAGKRQRVSLGRAAYIVARGPRRKGAKPGMASRWPSSAKSSTL